jgi:hypothetical protein
MISVFYLLAFICFVLTAAGVNIHLNLMALGLAFWVLALLIGPFLR